VSTKRSAGRHACTAQSSIASCFGNGNQPYADDASAGHVHDEHDDDPPAPQDTKAKMIGERIETILKGAIVLGTLAALMAWASGCSRFRPNTVDYTPRQATVSGLA